MKTPLQAYCSHLGMKYHPPTHKAQVLKARSSSAVSRDGALDERLDFRVLA